MTTESTQRTATATTPTWIFGAKGVLAGELLRLLDLHPTLRLRGAVSRSEQSVESAHPHLQTGASTCSADEARAAIVAAAKAGEKPAVLLALPHGESCAAWKALRNELGAHADEVYVVDLAADYRLRDPARYQAAYGHAHPDAAELERFVYGLVEFHRDAVRSAKRVAAPGCFATALQLACVPAARGALLDASKPWILHGITGSSGSGAEPKPGTHHPWRHGNLWAYSLGGHRHEAELAQALDACGVAPSIHFVAHSGPFARGIHLTCALPLARKATTADVRSHYADAFEGSPFVALCEAGRAPDLRSISGSNRALVAVDVRADVLTVLVTLDNMVKGGAGQALQCLNLMLGLPETAGLPRAGLGVC
jgi:N-acetyl-gamma-glutamyl-phosphate/LysW-gamma-L-alpha-aminoadipyl-6-phosphate reductase